MQDKLLIGLGIAALVSGIILTFQQQYIIGISGAIAGAGLVWQNLKKLREKK